MSVLQRGVYFGASLKRLLGVVCIAFNLALMGCQDTHTLESKANPPAVYKTEKSHPVLISPIAFARQGRQIQAVGTAKAQQSLTLYSEASGIVTRVNVRSGQNVQQGEVLLTLEDEDERLALELARVELKEAERELERYKKTVNAGAVTRRVLDEAASRTERARISLQQASLDASKRAVTAPFSGYVGISDIEPGALISDMTAITTLDDRSSLLVSFQLPELFHNQVKPGQALTLNTWSNSEEPLNAEVIEVDSRVDLETRTFLVRAQVDNAEDTLRPGMSFRVELSLLGNRYPKIPETALQWGGDGAFVWQIRDNRSYRVPSTIVQRVPGFILINADLKAGDQVVREGVQNLREGGLVRVKQG